jgi:hypothetical protein
VRRHIENGRVYEAYSAHEWFESVDPSQRPEPARSDAVAQAKHEGDRIRALSLKVAGLEPL